MNRPALKEKRDSQEKRIKISAIVPTYNGARMLADTLRSLRYQSLLEEEYEIVVVVDGSTDNTMELIHSMNREPQKKIRPVFFEQNLGLHSARHAGAKAARGEILAYTDDDAICDRNWLAALFSEYRSESIACVGGKILPKWLSIPPQWMKHFAPWTLSLLDYGEERKELEWPENIFGCNFSVRKSMLVKFGGFNPELIGDKWVGDGEAGLLRKLFSAGLKIVYAPEAIVWHVIQEDRASLPGMKKRFANYAASHSCCEFKLHRYSKLRLFLRSLYFFLNSNRHYLLGRRDQWKGSDISYLRQALTTYNRARSLYELRLIIDRKLIKLVNREDWLNE